jgi:hypothetical protein
MAKSNSKEQQEDIDFLKKQRESYENAIKVIREFNKASQERRGAMEKDLIAARKIKESFDEQFKSIKNINELIEKLSNNQEKLEKSAKKYKESLDDLINPSEELLDLQNSILNTHGKQSAEYDIITHKILGQKEQLQSISSIMMDLDDVSEHQKEILFEAVEAYKSQDASMGRLRKQVLKGDITLKQYNDEVISLSGYWEDIISKIDTTNPKLAGLYEILKGMNSEAATFNIAQAKASNAKSDALRNVGNVVGSTVGGRTGGLISSGTDATAGAIGGDKSLKTAGIIGLIVGALGIVKGLNNFYQQLNKAKYDALRLLPEMEENINNINISLGRAASNSRNFVKELALLDFSGELRQSAAQFQAASKTAFFGQQLTGIKGNTALLQLAGFSAEKIASAMMTISSGAGLNNNNDLAKNFAILSQNMGLSEDAAAGIVSSFKLLDNVGAKEATDRMLKFRTEAQNAGINIGSASQNLADAAKDALRYQIRSSAELSKQVMFANKIGVSFKTIAEAGRQSVLDYQGQIEAERELETLLQTSIDLSRYRSLMAQPGGQDKAIKELQSMEYLNPANMNVFEQEALANMLKLPLEEIQKIFSKGYVERTPLGTPQKELSLTDLNNQYLQTFKDAMASLKVATATIDAEQAILRAPVDTELKAMQLTDIFNVAKRAQVETLNTLEDLANAAAIAKDIALPNATDKALAEQRVKQLALYQKVNPGVSLQAAGIPTLDNQGFPSVSPNSQKFSLKPIKTIPIQKLDEERFLKDESLKQSIDKLEKSINQMNENGLGLQVDTVVRNESGKVMYEKTRNYAEYQKNMTRQGGGKLGYTNSDFIK